MPERSPTGAAFAALEFLFVEDRSVRMCLSASLPVFAVALVVAGSAAAEVQLSSNLPSGQPVGTPVVWTATTTETDPVDFRLSVALESDPLRVMYDFSDRDEFPWVPIEEGSYTVEARMRNLTSGEVFVAVETYEIESRAGGGPIATATGHPLVFLYSAPPCSAGELMSVRFAPLSNPANSITSTPRKECRDEASMNFYLAGMLEESLYGAQHEIWDDSGSLLSRGPALTLTTGSIDVTLPTNEVLNPIDSQTSSTERILLVSGIVGRFLPPVAPFPFAVDLLGRPIWYFDEQNIYSLYRSVDGGTFLGAFDSVSGRDGQVLREYDLVGSTLRETSAARISEQLLDMGFTDPFIGFHHDARRFGNGDTVFLGNNDRLLIDVQGPGAVDVVGDYIVVLDEDWQVKWAWNGFDHLDVTRRAILDEKCFPGVGCEIRFLDIGNDWTHGNAVVYSPTDGNLLLSSRHQDFIYKIDYQDGAGTGDVLWSFGPGGDFDLPPGTDPFPFQSHQHDPNLVGSDIIPGCGDFQCLSVFDNGNTRCDVNDDCESRGQVYLLDESTMSATPLLSTRLGHYSFAVGTSHALANGNFHFNSGWVFEGFFESTSFQTEVTPGGSVTYQHEANIASYRAARMRDLYTSPDAFLGAIGK